MCVYTLFFMFANVFEFQNKFYNLFDTCRQTDVHLFVNIDLTLWNYNLNNCSFIL